VAHKFFLAPPYWGSTCAWCAQNPGVALRVGKGLGVVPPRSLFCFQGQRYLLQRDGPGTDALDVGDLNSELCIRT